MIDILLGAADLSLICFARSPLEEAIQSLSVPSDARRSAMHRPWLAAAGSRISGLDLDLLRALVCQPNVLPDFLCPPPTRMDTQFHEELAYVRASTAEQVRAGIDDVRGTKPVPPVLNALYDAPERHLGRLVDQIDDYWQAAIEPVWPRLSALLEADLAYRARCLTTGGLAGLFADLHPEIEYRGDSVRIHKPHHSYQRPASDTGMLLVPCVFGWPRLTVLYTEDVARPALGYPARGVADVWSVARDTQGAPLADLMGRTRSQVLASLDLPMSTTHIAALLGMTTPTASHHLSVLRRCNLVSSQRSGREVLYQRTPLGSSLLDSA
ncbi:ArsR/SmtB family transcription factor [Streptomyces albidochromogenes]|uniref:DUF5937 family protein n=1 Tax=Streptomyces albidochromogenes TaxID=329524 RepID=A0ABW6FFM3_9ACTN